ncbi:DegV family protein [Skermania sp. ID1734]|uniref:DegV family protein n=1 Tax=Skermania sp. ID1734 TaxID=2597516 RepID=UPI00117C32C8|nr:DegV family protein [Skermania sp. ID1734]TSE00031.1 DegV family protein [Skermania sp. ID1734]
MAVIVVTDSSACIDPAVAEDLNIRVVPLHVLVDGETLREGVDDIPVPPRGMAVTTSAAAPGEMTIAFRRALAMSEGDGVVAVHLSRLLSGTWEAARQASSEFDGSVRVVDSMSAGLGTGFAAIAAARVARSGGSLDEVYQCALDVAEDTHSWLVVDRVDELRRGGRFDANTGRVGSVLASRLLLRLVGGKLELIDKSRTSSKALSKMVDEAVSAAAVAPVSVAVQHVAARERAQRVAAQLRKRIPEVSDVVIREFGPTLAVHLGGGAVAALVVPRRKD